MDSLASLPSKLSDLRFLGDGPNVWQGIASALVGAMVAVATAKRVARYTTRDEYEIQLQLALWRDTVNSFRELVALLEAWPHRLRYAQLGQLTEVHAIKRECDNIRERIMREARFLPRGGIFVKLDYTQYRVSPGVSSEVREVELKTLLNELEFEIAIETYPLLYRQDPNIFPGWVERGGRMLVPLTGSELLREQEDRSQAVVGAIQEAIVAITSFAKSRPLPDKAIRVPRGRVVR